MDCGFRASHFVTCPFVSFPCLVLSTFVSSKRKRRICIHADVCARTHSRARARAGSGKTRRISFQARSLFFLLLFPIDIREPVRPAAKCRNVHQGWAYRALRQPFPHFISRRGSRSRIFIAARAATRVVFLACSAFLRRDLPTYFFPFSLAARKCCRALKSDVPDRISNSLSLTPRLCVRVNVTISQSVNVKLSLQL